MGKEGAHSSFLPWAMQSLVLLSWLCISFLGHFHSHFHFHLGQLHLLVTTYLRRAQPYTTFPSSIVS